MRVQGPFEGHRRRKLLIALQALPRRNVGDGGDYHPEKSEAVTDGQNNRDGETSRPKSGLASSAYLPTDSKPPEQPWHNLPHQEYGNAAERG